MSTDAQLRPLPPELGKVTDRFVGSAPFAFDLLAADYGHPAESESVLVSVLKHRHTAHPYAWVFTHFEASHKQGEPSFDQEEVDVSVFRSFSNEKRYVDVVQYLVHKNMTSAAWAFTATSQPATRYLPLDDWLEWATCRDALRLLDASSGQMELSLSLLGRIARAGAAHEAADLLFSLFHLRWTAEEWLARSAAVKSLDIPALLAALPQPMPAREAVASFLERSRALACAVYESNLRRTEVLVRGAVQSTRRSGASRAALIVAIPWVGYAADNLRGEGVGFEQILPHKVRMVPMLDHAATILHVLPPDQQVLGDALLGHESRSRIEITLETEASLASSRAGDWAMAGQAYATRYERRRAPEDLRRAEECITRALDCDDRDAHAWWLKGELLWTQQRHAEALSCHERALALEPRSGHHWRAMAVVLDDLGRARPARRCFLRAIYVEPHNGFLWGALGFHYHRHGRPGAALYCLNRGKELRDEDAARYLDILFSGRNSRPRDCPLPLLPLVIHLMNRAVLPLRYAATGGGPGARGAFRLGRFLHEAGSERMSRGFVLKPSGPPLGKGGPAE